MHSRDLRYNPLGIRKITGNILGPLWISGRTYGGYRSSGGNGNSNSGGHRYADGLLPPPGGTITRPSSGFQFGNQLYASPTLIVEGIPADCTAREAEHIFRLCNTGWETLHVKKIPTRPGASQVYTVTYDDKNCAAAALKVLNGYDFDRSRPNLYRLRVEFGHLPGRRGI